MYKLPLNMLKKGNSKLFLNDFIWISHQKINFEMLSLLRAEVVHKNIIMKVIGSNKGERL